jgi:hypothetical protein
MYIYIHTHTHTHTVFSRHLQYMVHNNGRLYMGRNAIRYTHKKEHHIFQSCVDPRFKKNRHTSRKYTIMKSSHTPSDSYAFMTYLTTLSLLQECTDSNGRSWAQKEDVVAKFKTTPEFSGKECGKPPKMSG